jgi:hypothetical protein
MSADPVTLAIISTTIQGVGAYSGLQAQKAQNKAIIAEYERDKKFNQLKGLQDSNDVLEEARRKRKQNLAIVAGSGYSDDSGSFLTTQAEIDRIAERDIRNIKINVLRGESKLDSQIYSTRVMGKAQKFGTYAKIAAAGFKTRAYIKSYRGQYSGGMQSDGNYYDPYDPGQTE